MGKTNTSDEVKEWRKSIKGEIKHHVLLIVFVALTILEVLALCINFITTKSLLNEATVSLTEAEAQAVYSHFIQAIIVAAVVIVVVGGVLMGIASSLVLKLAEGIGTPIAQCTERLKLLAEGDLRTPVPEIHREDEAGALANVTEEIVSTMTVMIGDINYVMQNMGAGNFAVHSNARESFVGDFSGILDSERQIVIRLSETVKGIRVAAEQVSQGSTQLSENSQNLAEGATDQASSVEELLATVTDVTDKAVRSSEEAAAVGKNAQAMGEEAKASTKQMDEMKAAMQRISEKSNQISGVIQSIEEIAEQTNLLALNASIEAARAGERGKGFAVVANEIGMLAKQSADAVENTRKLIEDSLREVESGHEIVDVTADTLQKLIEGLEKIVIEIEAVGEVSMQQAEMIKQLNDGIGQISAVIEANSASAQECSATSEELSAQAITMKEMMEKFQIRE